MTLLIGLVFSSLVLCAVSAAVVVSLISRAPLIETQDERFAQLAAKELAARQLPAEAAATPVIVPLARIALGSDFRIPR